MYNIKSALSGGWGGGGDQGWIKEVGLLMRGNLGKDGTLAFT